MRREHGLTSDYEVVEWLKPVGVCYIDTGLTLEADTTIITCEWKEKFVTRSGSYMIAVSFPNAGLQVYNNGDRVFNQSAQLTATNNSIITCKTTTTYSERRLWVNGTGTVQYYTRSITDGTNIYLFAQPDNRYQFIDPVYYMQIYINNILKRDYIPVKRLSDSVYGWYDNETQTFDSGIGGGYFTI